MTIETLLGKYLELLWTSFQYDYEVFSKPWLYAWLIPVMFYLMFFICKWCVLTFPLWGPVMFALSIPIRMIRELKYYRIKKLIKYTEEKRKGEIKKNEIQ